MWWWKWKRRRWKQFTNWLFHIPDSDVVPNLKKISANKNYLFCDVLIIGEWWANTSWQFIAKEIMMTEL